MLSNEDKIKQIWRQPKVPVIYRKGTGYPLVLRLPFHKDNYAWLRNEQRRKPQWVGDKKYWEIPMAWFNDTVARALNRWGALYIIQPYREQEKCAPACWNAEGHLCECSCMGEKHGSGNPEEKWFIASDSFATKWGEKELACRLLSIKP